MSEAPTLTGLKLGNYRLERVLGRGRMGVVYLANDEALLRPTAVKVLSWSMVAPAGQDPEAWFIAEARSVARINHPAVVQIYGVARHGPHCYIAMEYVEGVSADVLVAEDGPFSPDHATEVVAQIAGALQLAHSCDIIHRDVKAANLLVGRDGSAKLGDFGMALHLDAPANSGVQRAGTPHYIAPELWRGEAASAASDIYALGATYHFLLTGSPPFNSRDVQAVAEAHLHEEVRAAHELCPGVPPQCSAIIRRCMAKRPADRYPSAQELQWELRGLLRAMAAPASASRSAAAVDAPGGAPAHLHRYDGAPFGALRQRLAARMAAGSGAVLLTGDAGSGRSVLARSLLAEAPAKGTQVYLDLANAASTGRTLVQRVARAFGALPKLTSGASADLDGLLDHLRLILTGDLEPALLVLDSLTAAAPLVDELTLLARAAESTGYLRLLLVGPPELGDALAGVVREPPLVMPPLDAAQTRAFLDDWARAGAPADAPPFVITPDAALLVWRRSEGNLRRINQLAANMLRLAERAGARALSSWEAWIAPADDGAAIDGARFLRPAAWPSEEALRLLNELRAAIGAPERQ